MLLTLMMNIGMFGESFDGPRQELVFDSEFEGDIQVNTFEGEFGVDSLIEQVLNADGSEINFGFDSRIQTGI